MIKSKLLKNPFEEGLSDCRKKDAAKSLKRKLSHQTKFYVYTKKIVLTQDIL